ncbi:hypothetical protein FOZ60_006896 [Perkinsus olseni]|uniref:Uncharacterized protein n=1 Tax=Perkinsus olseni TaxID=32597 RepID=A0A7J6NMJ9_PEROL|nr:hypothetical protein FOZ60_006896 [Perkinsus olseni]
MSNRRGSPVYVNGDLAGFLNALADYEASMRPIRLAALTGRLPAPDTVSYAPPPDPAQPFEQELPPDPHVVELPPATSNGCCTDACGVPTEKRRRTMVVAMRLRSDGDLRMRGPFREREENPAGERPKIAGVRCPTPLVGLLLAKGTTSSVPANYRPHPEIGRALAEGEFQQHPREGWTLARICASLIYSCRIERIGKMRERCLEELLSRTSINPLWRSCLELIGTAT